MKLSECEPPLLTSPLVFTSLKCSVLRFVELTFDVLYTLLSDPIAAWRAILFFGFYFLQDQLSFLCLLVSARRVSSFLFPRLWERSALHISAFWCDVASL